MRPFSQQSLSSPFGNMKRNCFPRGNEGSNPNLSATQVHLQSGFSNVATLSWLRARAERSEFARLLDEAIPGDARVVEIGCGTGQMSLYLARADRVVIGADLTRESLRLGAEAARRFELDHDTIHRNRLASPRLASGRFRCCLLVRGLAPHSRPERGVHARSAPCTARRDHCSRGLQRIRTHSSPGTALRRSAIWIPIHPV